ncbi:MAG: 2-octaprenyl-6-methoxyphenyl hydroxylase [Steroidobacteraceae bacterium]
MAERFDLAIVGGGLVGASLAVALSASKLRIALVEAFAPDSASQPSFDERTTALGNASRRVFEAVGLWAAMEPDAAPITDIHVSDAGRFGFARLAAKDFGVPALGYVVPNRVLGRVLWEGLRHTGNVTLFMPMRVSAVEPGSDAVGLALESTATGSMGAQRIDARLVVAADGANSLVREAAGLSAMVDDYHQVAVVAAIRTDQANDGTAYERFTAAGPMALLPLRGAAQHNWRTLVWAARPDDAKRLLALEAPAFLAEWQQAFGWRAGRAMELGRRVPYPLALSRSSEAVAHRIAMLGNASQLLHPVAGQGFNLGLRDAAELAEVLAAGPADPGSDEVLADFAARRKADRGGVVRFTDTLVRTFSNTNPAVALARDAGLLAFDLLPPAKRALSRVSLGFGARAPRLTRGLMP